MSTDVYEFDTVDPSLLGWDALLMNNFDKIEAYNYTLLRYQVASGEVIISGEAVNLYRDYWRTAKADGSRQPIAGVAIESGISGEWVRARSKGPFTANCFNFIGSGEYIYLNNSGEFVSTAPSTNVEIVGYALAHDKLFINPLPVSIITPASNDIVDKSDGHTYRVVSNNGMIGLEEIA
ncbi:MAG: hypothetical protein ABFC98_05850 [Candidatus Cloacimonas sp.]